MGSSVIKGASKWVVMSSLSTLSNAYVVLCTCPKNEVATDLAHQIIASKLAACVNIVPGLTSIFCWQGKTETAIEVLLLIKTTAKAYPKLEALLAEAHPYDCPEVIGLPIELGIKGYLEWIKDNVLATA
jgi:periplasmic divalent cation tolerance protein